MKWYKNECLNIVCIYKKASAAKKKKNIEHSSAGEHVKAFKQEAKTPVS